MREPGEFERAWDEFLAGRRGPTKEDDCSGPCFYCGDDVKATDGFVLHRKCAGRMARACLVGSEEQPLPEDIRQMTVADFCERAAIEDALFWS